MMTVSNRGHGHMPCIRVGRGVGSFLYGIIITLCMFILYSCGSFTDPQHGDKYDIAPPAFVSAKNADSGGIELEFNEEIALDKRSLRTNPSLDIIDAYPSGEKLIIVTGGQTPGMEYNLEVTVSDVHDNTTNVIIDFYGFNPSVPSLVINEFITNGSATHPDLVELKVTGSGNLAGVVLFTGVKGNFDSRIVFPALEVGKGDYILVHFKPQAIEAETDEVASKTLSGGLDASADAYDFWVRGGNGLSGNNGVLSLYTSPSGELIDGVLYSNRTRDSDTLYSGFGSEKMMNKAVSLSSDSGWETAEDSVYPEDAVNPEDSTSTRSICRNKSGTDNDSKTDWHIVPTKKSSFGGENCDEVYVGK